MLKNAIGLIVPALYSKTPISRSITKCVFGSSEYVARRLLVAAVHADHREVRLNALSSASPVISASGSSFQIAA